MLRDWSQTKEYPISLYSNDTFLILIPFKNCLRFEEMFEHVVVLSMSASVVRKTRNRCIVSVCVTFTSKISILMLRVVLSDEINNVGP